MHSDYTCYTVCVFPGNWTTTFCVANTMLYHWDTGTHDRHTTCHRLMWQVEVLLHKWYEVHNLIVTGSRLTQGINIVTEEFIEQQSKGWLMRVNIKFNILIIVEMRTWEKVFVLPGTRGSREKHTPHWTTWDTGWRRLEETGTGDRRTRRWRGHRRDVNKQVSSR